MTTISNCCWRNELLLIAVILLCVTHHCYGLLPFSLPPPPLPAAIQRSNDLVVVTTATTSTTAFKKSEFPSAPSMVRDATVLLSALERNDPLTVQTQSQQMNDAMVIKTMTGTQWRVVEERFSTSSSFGKDSPRMCKSSATFSGFVGDANKGTVGVEYACGGDDDDDDPGSGPAPPISTSGRWVSKPKGLARGSIQLTARWKVKVPGGGTVIYKGFIDADKIIGRSGKSVSAEMVGTMLTGEEVNKEKKIGKFTADLVRQFDAAEEAADAATRIAEANANSGPITLSPK